MLHPLRKSGKRNRQLMFSYSLDRINIFSIFDDIPTRGAERKERPPRPVRARAPRERD